LRECFVDDRNRRRTVSLGRFGGGEVAAAQDRYSHGGEIVRADAVETRAEGKPFRRRGRLVILGHVHAGTLDGSA
jgi:hypothetical protein